MWLLQLELAHSVRAWRIVPPSIQLTLHLTAAPPACHTFWQEAGNILDLYAYPLE